MLGNRVKTIMKKQKIDNIDIEIANRLREYRRSMNLSQKNIGEILGVSVQQVQKYEKAVNRISSGNLYRISKLFQLPITYFFEDDVANNLTANINKEFSDQDFSKIIKKITDQTIRNLLFKLAEYIALNEQRKQAETAK
jgi:transcriptional regulator with XRE-family HTH domain